MILDLSPSSLLCHEEVEENQVHELCARIVAEGGIKTPLLVDYKTYVVLDGHHRLQVAKTLNLVSIPCQMVNYDNDAMVQLASWKENVRLTKQDVLDAAFSGRLLPAKTSRHTFNA